MRMTFLRYLEKVRSLLTKGYKVRSTEDAIELDTPSGDILSPLQAVVLEETGEQLVDDEFETAMQRIRMDRTLAERILEAEEDLDCHWPRYRAAIREALGISNPHAA